MKKGISLIVLVITIIVMIILAASVVITLSNTGVINRASEAVDATNQSQVQDLAALIWADAYMGGKRGTELEAEVTTKLSEQGVTATDWNITVTNTGVTINEKYKGPTLGSLITADNYGDTVDYSVTVNGITYSDWQIYYHNNEYVYLISKNSIGETTLNKGITVASLTANELDLYDKFRVGISEKYVLTDAIGSNTMYGCQAVAQLIKEYGNFANTNTYGTNVIGAIGGPTIELVAAGWNAKNYTPTFNVSKDTYGYNINDYIYVDKLTTDSLYFPNNMRYAFASPAQGHIYNAGDCLFAWSSTTNFFGDSWYGGSLGVRPVVCLKASIPATVGTTTDFSLAK